MIRHGDGASVRREVIATQKIHVALSAHDHYRRGQLDVGEPGCVRAFAVVEGAGRVEHALHHREGNHRAAVMVIAPFHIRREGRLVILVNADCQIVPPHEGQGRVRGIVHNGLGLHHRGAGIYGDAHGGAHAVEGLRFAHPAGLRAVSVLLQGGFSGHEGGGAVMLGPVELHAAGHPWPCQTDHGGLDAHILINKLIAVALLHRAVNFAAQLRQQLHVDVFVGECDPVVGLFHRLVAQPIGVGNGIDPAYFSRMFRKAMGQSPSQFLKSHKEERPGDA